MALEISNLTLTMRKRRILDAVSATIMPGRVTVILGPNGAGKSSLLSSLAGIRVPDEGHVAIDGNHISTLPLKTRARSIGLLPQSTTIHWDMSVRNIVALGRLPHTGGWGMTAADHSAIDEAMAVTDVAHLAERAVTRLSGGEQGRVLLARVLAGEPKWLLADEPLANMDPAYQLDVLNRLKTCADTGTGVVVVLHDLTHAARIADDVIILKSGSLLAAGSQESILTPAILAEAYGVQVHDANTPDGHRLLVPIHRL